MTVILSPLLERKEQCPFRCRAELSHVVFKLIWSHPNASLKEIAKLGRINYPNVREIVTRIRKRRDLQFICPNCFRPQLFDITCENCGFSLDTPIIEIDPDSEEVSKTHSPVKVVYNDRGLGSEFDYSGLGWDYSGKRVRVNFAYGNENVKHLMGKNSGLYNNCKSDIFEISKALNLTESTTEQLLALLKKEVVQFQTNFPDFKHSTLTRKALVKKVCKILCLRMPKYQQEIDLILPLLFAPKAMKVPKKKGEDEFD